MSPPPSVRAPSEVAASARSDQTRRHLLHLAPTDASNLALMLGGPFLVFGGAVAIHVGVYATTELVWLAALCSLSALNVGGAWAFSAFINRRFAQSYNRRAAVIAGGILTLPGEEGDREIVLANARPRLQRYVVSRNVQTSSSGGINTRTSQVTCLHLNDADARIRLDVEDMVDANGWGIPTIKGTPESADLRFEVWAHELLPACLALGYCTKRGGLPSTKTFLGTLKLALKYEAIFAVVLLILFGVILAVG